MKDKTLALAGVVQSAELVRQAACHGTWSGYAATACLDDVASFRNGAVPTARSRRRSFRCSNPC